MIINGILSFFPVWFASTKPGGDVENRLWRNDYFSLVQISVWANGPMIIDIILDIPKLWENRIQRTGIYIRIISVCNLMIPGILQLRLPYDSNPGLAWDLQEGILLSQSNFIIGTLLLSLLSDDDLGDGKKLSVEGMKQFRMVRPIIRILFGLLLGKIFFVLLRIYPRSTIVRILSGATIAVVIMYFFFTVVNFISILYQKTEEGRFQSPQDLKNFLHLLCLLFYFLPFVVYFAVELSKGESIFTTTRLILVSRFKVLFQVIYTYFLTVIPARVSMFHAWLEGEKLLKKLNTIRYVSHEMRTPLNTVYLSVQVAQDQITELITGPKKKRNFKLRASKSETDMRKLLSAVETDRKFTKAVNLNFQDDHIRETTASVEALKGLNETIGHIKSGCDVVLATLNDLLTADKVEDNKLTLARLDLNPWKLVNEVGSSFNLLAKEKNIRYNVICRDEESKWFDRYNMFADNFKLSQVLRNFISNALKFTPVNGEVSVTLEKLLSQVEDGMGSQSIGTAIRVSVTDSGAGISEENQKKLFGQYVQFKADELQQGKGSGLGLWISKKIIELHGGLIGAWSDGEEKGCTFFFELPVQPLKHSEIDQLSLLRMRSKSSVASPRSESSVSMTFRSMFYRMGSRTHSRVAVIDSSSTSITRRVTDLDDGQTNSRSLSLRERIKSFVENGEAHSRQSSSYRELPSDASDIQSLPPEKADEMVNDGYWDNGLKMLVVDDSALNRKMTMRLLKSCGHSVSELEDGSDFVSLIENNEYRKQEKNEENKQDKDYPRIPNLYDVVLMDDNMPGLCGPEATKQVRSLGYKGVVIGVTGNAFEDQIQNYLSCGANAVLQKPLDIIKLKTLVSKMLSTTDNVIEDLNIHEKESNDMLV